MTQNTNRANSRLSYNNLPNDATNNAPLMRDACVDTNVHDIATQTEQERPGTATQTEYVYILSKEEYNSYMKSSMAFKDLKIPPQERLRRSPSPSLERDEPRRDEPIVKKKDWSKGSFRLQPQKIRRKISPPLLKVLDELEWLYCHIRIGTKEAEHEPTRQGTARTTERKTVRRPLIEQYGHLHSMYEAAKDPETKLDLLQKFEKHLENPSYMPWISEPSDGIEWENKSESSAKPTAPLVDLINPQPSKRWSLPAVIPPVIPVIKSERASEAPETASAPSAPSLSQETASSTAIEKPTGKKRKRKTKLLYPRKKAGREGKKKKNDDDDDEPQDDNWDDIPCTKCNSLEDKENCLVCEACDIICYHIYCLDPPCLKFPWKNGTVPPASKNTKKKQKKKKKRNSKHLMKTRKRKRARSPNRLLAVAVKKFVPCQLKIIYAT
eukprot:Platyproteum_vivax@DN7325_c0_g1_i2.p1